jgi:hypothetical protein
MNDRSPAIAISPLCVIQGIRHVWFLLELTARANPRGCPFRVPNGPPARECLSRYIKTDASGSGCAYPPRHWIMEVHLADRAPAAAADSRIT